MRRLVEPELLDDLPTDDARAIRSRADLRRLNWLMRHADIIRVMLESKLQKPPRCLIELGAGDGTLLLNIAERTHARWSGVMVKLVDQQKTVSNQTLARFRELGWRVEIITADVFEWLVSADTADAMIANLFLHHFSEEKLATLLSLIESRTDLFIACETRRDWTSFAITRSLALFGCNTVTRHDAIKSAQAGFVGEELSGLWANRDLWKLTEKRHLIFTHLFVAQRRHLNSGPANVRRREQSAVGTL